MPSYQKRDNEYSTVKKLINITVDRKLRAAGKSSGLKFLGLTTLHGGGGGGGSSVDETIKAVVLGYTGATAGVETVVMRAELLGKGGVFLYDNQASNRVEVHYSPVADPQFWMPVI